MDTSAIGTTPKEPMFVRKDTVVEEIDLYVDHVVEPVHCIRVTSELVDAAMMQAVYEQVAITAYHDKLLTTTKEIIGPLPPQDATFVAPPPATDDNSYERVPVSPTRLPSMILRLFDQAPSTDMALTSLDTNVTLAIREVLTRSLGWVMWDVSKLPSTAADYRRLQDDIIHHQLAAQQQRQIAPQPGTAASAATAIVMPPFVPGVLGAERTILRFSKRATVIREVDITEQVIQEQEERQFRRKQQESRAAEQQRFRYYSLLCSTAQMATSEKKLEAIQKWISGIEEQVVKAVFTDAARRTVLHWIVDWSEEAYPQNRLGDELLRSHMFFAFEIGLSPLAMDASAQTPMSIASSTREPRKRALRHFRDAALRSRCTSQLPLESIVFESVAGRFLQTQFSATQSTKFFSLELVHVSAAGSFLNREATVVSGSPKGASSVASNVHGSPSNAATTGSFFAIFLYDLALEWKFPVMLFTNRVVPEGMEYRPESSSLRFYVVPFCRDSHATTEGDILMCSNGYVIGVDYTTPHPTVSPFLCPSFEFDVLGGEGTGYCCTVQWRGADSGAVLEQHRREQSARVEKERAAQRVARSYLNELAKEIDELEMMDGSEPKTNDDFVPHDVFDEAFAERMLLYPYGPQPTNPAGSNEGVEAGGSSGTSKNAGTPFTTSRLQQRSPGVASFARTIEWPATAEGSFGRSVSGADASWTVPRHPSVQMGAPVDSPPSSPTLSAPQKPLGAVCVLRRGELLVIPLSRFALTSHATAKLRERVERLSHALQVSLQRHDRSRMPQSAAPFPSGGGLRVSASRRESSVAGGLFTPMANGNPLINNYEPTISPALLSSRNAPHLRGALALEEGEALHDSADDTPNASRLMSVVDVHASMLQSRTSRGGDDEDIDDASHVVLYPRVLSLALSLYCREPRGPITLASTASRILVGLPNNEILQYTVSNDKFMKILPEIVPESRQSAKSPRRSTNNNKWNTPLGGADQPCVLLAQEYQQPSASKPTDDTADAAVLGSATVVWSGKGLSVRAVNPWRHRDVSAPSTKEIFVDDCHLDQEVVCPTLHPVHPHILVFSRRSYLCYLNTKTGFVAKLCPIVLSEAEFAMRSKHMDKSAGASSSGIEMLSFNASGTLLMRYSPMYRSATLYDASELMSLVEKEDRSLVKSTSLICGFPTGDSGIPSSAANTKDGSVLPRVEAANGALTVSLPDVTRSLKSVPKERLRGYLERITTNKFKSAPQSRVDHAFFVVQALTACPTFHANVGDGDGRNTACVLAAIDQQDMLKDTLMSYWDAVMDDGANLNQCSDSGARAWDDAVLSTHHLEILYAYATRQQKEIALRENAVAPTMGPTPTGTPRRAWEVTLGTCTPQVRQACVVDVFPERPARLYTLQGECLKVQLEESSPGGLSSTSTDLVPTGDTSFAVLPISDACDVILFASGKMAAVEYPANAAPIATIRNLSEVPLVTNLMVDPSQQRFLRPCRVAASLHVDDVSLLGSWCHVNGRRLEGETTPAAHVAFYFECLDSRDHSLPAGGIAMDVPLLLTQDAWEACRSAIMSEVPQVDVILSALQAGFQRGLQSPTCSTVTLPFPLAAFDLACDGPMTAFVYVEAQSMAASTVGAGGGGVGEESGRTACHINDCERALGWRRLDLIAKDGQQWQKPVTWEAGNPVEARLRFDHPTDTLYLTIGSAELAVVEVDRDAAQQKPQRPPPSAFAAITLSVDDTPLSVNGLSTAGHEDIAGKVMYFFESVHGPVAESIRCLWTTRDRVRRVLHDDRGNTRPMTALAGDDTLVTLRPDNEEAVLLMLREGHLVVLDLMVRKAAVVVGTLPLHRAEISCLIDDGDVPDPTEDPSLAKLEPMKVLCGGLHALCGLSASGTLFRFNELHQCVVAVDFKLMCSLAATAADAVDEYGHLGGGLPSRTLVQFPYHLFQSEGEASKRRPTLPGEILEQYAEPLRYEHTSPLDLVSQGWAPPRSTRLRGFLSAQTVETHDVIGTTRLLQLMVVAIQSGCTAPSQRDRNGRTALHIFADLFPNLPSTAQRIEWLNCLFGLRCNVFACDNEGRSVLDRRDIRQFLFDEMGSCGGADHGHISLSTDVTSVPYAAYFEAWRSVGESSIGADESSTAEGSGIRPVVAAREVVQCAWSHVSTGILYAMQEGGALLRLAPQRGAVDVSGVIPRWKHSVCMKVTAMSPSCTNPDGYGDEMPLDHQPADIILFSNGAICIVYDPEHDATVQVYESGGPRWNPSVAPSFEKGDPVAPSRLHRDARVLTEDPNARSSQSLSPLCPSEQHSGMEVAWFVAAGQLLTAAASGAAAPVVAMLVATTRYHTVTVSKLYPIPGVDRVFPRHTAAMAKAALVTEVPLIVPRPDLVSLSDFTRKDIVVYETAREHDQVSPLTNAVSSPPLLTEMEPQRFTQLYRATHSPYGDVFYVVTQRGFVCDSTMYVHVFRCPTFTPLHVIAVTSPFAKDLALQGELYMLERGSYFSDHVAQQHMWGVVQRQLRACTLSITDRSLAWVEGGGGLCVATWDRTTPKINLQSKGDHLAQRMVGGCSESTSVDACSPGYHREDRVFVAVGNGGQCFTYQLHTGESAFAGTLKLPDDQSSDLVGDMAVSVSCDRFSKTNRRLRRGEQPPFVCVHNLTTRACFVIPYASVRRARNHASRGLESSFLCYSPQAILSTEVQLAALSRVVAPQSVTEPEVGLALSDEAATATTKAAVTEALDEWMNADADARFQDPVTLRARMDLRAVLEEQYAADAKVLAREAEQKVLMDKLLKGAHGSVKSGQRPEPVRPKECQAWYWALVTAIPRDAQSGAPCVTDSLEALLTLERTYVAMLWPVLRGRASVHAIQDSTGCTLLWYAVVFYASYFSLVDRTTPLLMSAKLQRVVEAKKRRMVEEWQTLLALRAATSRTDFRGFSLESHAFRLHAFVGDTLRATVSALVASFLRLALPEASEERSTATSASDDSAAVSKKRTHRLSSCFADHDMNDGCGGTYVLGTLSTSDMSIEIVRHSATCCGRGVAFVSTREDSHDVLMEFPVADIGEGIVFVQMPWLPHGALLIASNAVMAIQIAPNVIAGGSTSMTQSQRSRLVQDISYAASSSRRKSSSSASIIMRYTVPLSWRAESKKRSTWYASAGGVRDDDDADDMGSVKCLSHWTELTEERVMFQFAGVYAQSSTSLMSGRAVCFLRMWECPIAFAKSESLSALARYTADQLQGAAAQHTIKMPPQVIPSEVKAEPHCIAAGHTVLYFFGSSAFAAVRACGNDGKPTSVSLLSDPTVLPQIAALADMMPLPDWSTSSNTRTTLSAGGNSQRLSHRVMRTSPGTLIRENSDDVRLFRLLEIRGSDSVLVPVALIPPSLCVRRSSAAAVDSYSMVRCFVVRNHLAAQHASISDAPHSGHAEDELYFVVALYRRVEGGAAEGEGEGDEWVAARMDASASATCGCMTLLRVDEFAGCAVSEADWSTSTLHLRRHSGFIMSAEDGSMVSGPGQAAAINFVVRFQSAHNRDNFGFMAIATDSKASL